ncbi:MAG: class I SAM-dependent methyltransferase [Gammaproteobacteria bacterium]|nr:class I SAM-dependent methyltransferase [Gammaproteobacteria bacterium]MBU1725984.1 class I SAM-dependent methyltransferase [Gammaproteobacteria bacterium]MBU2004969.1 class I SAM-dependent methyltransferase [Gammaproteobacteria bacterium]
MGALIKSLSLNSSFELFALSTAIIVIIFLMIIYIIAFVQGREVSFWPLRIGSRPKNNSKDKSLHCFPNVSESSDLNRGKSTQEGSLFEGLKVNLLSNSRLPQIPTPSTYNPVYPNESYRLRVQGDAHRDLDVRAFKRSLELLRNKENIIALDIGCGSGYVTKDRFDSFENFKKIFGIDNSHSAINEALKIKDERYTFAVIDIESPSFKDSIFKLKGAESGVDFIFSSFTLHHLSDPISILKTLKEILKPTGVLVIRSPDDGSKICYPDNDIMEKIIDVSSNAKGISDRFHGRKAYFQLKSSGFNYIDSLYSITDTVGRSSEERLKIFDESFSYRSDYVKRQLESGDESARENYNWLIDALKYLRKRFYSDDLMYYMEVQYVLIAQR